MNHRNMRREIAAVVFFLKRLVRSREKLDSHKVELFVERLVVALRRKFKGHWYPETPSKGQAYRCIRVNSVHRQDPELLRACRESGVRYSDLGLPRELTLWVDPGEVCCRYGEQGYCFSVATFSNEYEKDKDVVKVTSALERLTSDHHSGSSSNEASSLPLTMPSSRCANQALNPCAPAWHPKKMVPKKRHVLPLPHYSLRPGSVAPYALKQTVWLPPGYRGGQGYWDTNHNLATC